MSYSTPPSRAVGRDAAAGFANDASSPATGSASSSPGHAPPLSVPTTGGGGGPAIDREVAVLRERLRVSDEWNVRLQNQIQELLRLPRNEVEAMRERMQSPEIAIPLLQCYDAAILEKAEENDRLRRENAQLRTTSETRAGEHTDLRNAVRVAEELAQRVQQAAQEETSKAQQSLKEAQTECVHLRQELARALDAENDGKRQLERATKQAADLRKDMDTLLAEKARLEEALRAADAVRRQTQSAEGETLAQREAQKVQLSVLTRENEDRLEELERLRSRMIQALRQAADNHAAHMKVVEERHALVVEQLRTALRTQEMEVRRMRGQLAWADPNGAAAVLGSASAASGGSGSSDGLLGSTTRLVEAQTRLAQETEIKRLYNELAQVQMQRDDAVTRYEQLTATLRKDREQAQLLLQRETAGLQRGVEAAQQRARELEAELAASRRENQQLRDGQRRQQEHVEQLREARDEAVAQAQQAEAKEAATAARLVECEQQLARAEAATKERAAAQEQRIHDTLTEVQAAKGRAYAECERATQERDEAMEALREAQDRLAVAQRALGEGQRERQTMATQTRRLQEALEAHKRQLAACDERLVALQGQLEAAGQQSRTAQLAMERLRLENARLTRGQRVLA